jgi:hypothetical protein
VTDVRRNHIGNIGIIRNTLNYRRGLVHDYPDDDHDTADYGSADDVAGADSYDLDGYGEEGYDALAWPADRRWRPLAGIVGSVVALGAIATAVIINSGDSATTKATVGGPIPRTVTTAPAMPMPTAPPSQSAKPQLPPETVTTVAPPPSTVAAAPPIAAPAPTALPPVTALNPRTVIYSVGGTKQLIDLVNVVYTDARGYPQTEFNVSLPWTKMIVLNPGVQTVSVVATSIYSHLDCSVVNAAGQTVVASANNASITTCTR